MGIAGEGEGGVGVGGDGVGEEGEDVGGQAVGGAARVWLRVMPVLLVIAILLQLRSFRPAWLARVLGPGTEMLASGTVRQ